MITATLVLAACSRRAGPQDEPWFNPPLENTWTPDAAVIADMQVAFDEVLRPVLEAKVDLTRPRVHYWFQYRAFSSGNTRVIAIIGRPFPVARRADATFMGAFIPESCHVLASYRPDTHQIQDLAVGGFNCPPRI